eukprot:307070-Hanusia_phi.AAC.2
MTRSERDFDANIIRGVVELDYPMYDQGHRITRGLLQGEEVKYGDGQMKGTSESRGDHLKAATTRTRAQVGGRASK